MADALEPKFIGDQSFAEEHRDLPAGGSRTAPTNVESEPEETVIAYRPFAGMEKWLGYRFSAWSEGKAWFVMTLVALFYYLGGPGMLVEGVAQWLSTHLGLSVTGGAAALAVSSQAVLTYCLSFFMFAMALVGAWYYAQPTHLSISDRGIRRLWRRKFLKLTGPALDWQNVRHIQLVKPTGKTTLPDWWLSFNGKDGSSMKFRLGAVVTGADRAELLSAIDRCAPATTRDAELIEALAPVQENSYTDLWLKALSAPPKRERLTPLECGVLLCDGRYRVLEQLGVGGQGTAYLATDEEQELPMLVDKNARKNSDPANDSGTLSELDCNGRAVVLKESILPVYVDVNVTREALERFQNEALMLSKLDHPQIVKLRHCFVEDHRSYLVLEHIDGKSLRRLVSEAGPLPVEEVRELALKMCEILSYLHGLVPPVVHRDFTPDNLIYNSGGTLKLVDFNVAQQTDSTTTGTVVGKHAYLPPEQFRGKPTPQSDIYALGATLYFLLTGEDPEPITQSHPSIARQDVDQHMDRIVARATAPVAGERYKHIAELRDELLQSAGCQAVERS